MNRKSNNRCNSTYDCGPNPDVTDLSQATQNNENYRTALWSGTHLQLTTRGDWNGGTSGHGSVFVYSKRRGKGFHGLV